MWLKRLALLLFLVPFCSLYSKADITSVSLFNGQYSVNVSTGVDASPLSNIFNNPNAIMYSIPDDGVMSIPLSFDFKYFNQTFNQTWMYSNGVISFQNPYGNYCCDGQPLSNMSGFDYDYTLYPLWTDLIGWSGSNFYSLDKGNSIIYGWYNVNEYGTNNLINMEVELSRFGDINFRYSEFSITNHSATIGMTGNILNGEYYQYLNGYVTMAPTTLTTNFSIPSLPPPPPEDPCLIDPYSNPMCPEFVGNTKTTTNTTPTIVPQTNTIEDSTSTMTNVRTDAGGVSVDSTGVIKVEDGVPDVVKESTNLQTNQDGSTTLDPQAVAKSAVEEVKPSTSASKPTIQSISKQATQQKQIETIDDYIEQSSDQMQQMIKQDQSIQDSDTATQQASSSLSFGYDSFGVQVKEDQIDNQVNPLNSLYNVASKPQVAETKETTETINTKSEPNDAAEGGVDMTQLAKAIDGFDVYTKTAMNDTKFYKSEQVYKNQKTVDNESVLRRLNTKSDNLHQQIVNQQYR